MPTFQIALDSETFDRLAAIAVVERRPIPWQAEVVLRQALMSAARPLSTHEALTDGVPALIASKETATAHQAGGEGTSAHAVMSQSQ
jgi:hypothetical protein